MGRSILEGVNSWGSDYKHSITYLPQNNYCTFTNCTLHTIKRLLYPALEQFQKEGVRLGECGIIFSGGFSGSFFAIAFHPRFAFEIATVTF